MIRSAHVIAYIVVLQCGQAQGQDADRALPSRQDNLPGRDIVVIGTKPRGSVQGAIGPEVSYDAAAVEGLGASNLADVLAQLGGVAGGSQARAGDALVLLVNGRRIGAFADVQNLPPEAIARVDVLPEEAALRLGYPAATKPINIVLKPHYAAVTAEAEDRVTTWGLRNDFNTEMNAVRIAGDNRLTLDLQYQIGDAITEAKRGVVRPLGREAASAAGIVASANGGALAPSGVNAAAVPAQGRTLADFLGGTPVDDTGAWHTLTPATHELSVDASFARALAGGHSVSATLRGDVLTSHDLLGPAIASVTIPASDGPFAVPVRLNRRVADLPIETRTSQTATLHLGTQVAGFGRWPWSLAANYDHIGTSRRTAGGVDAGAWQAAITAGTLADPFAAPAAGLLVPAAPSASASHDDTLALDGLVSGTIGKAPAGDAEMTVRASLGREALVADAQAARTVLHRDHLGGQTSLDLPLLAPGGPVGALDLGLTAGADRWSDAGNTLAGGANLAWQPHGNWSLLLAAQHDATVPTMQQLGAPADISPALPIYVYDTGQTAIVAATTGGVAGLVADSRRTAKAELTAKPLAGFTLTATLTDIIDRNPVFAFAGATPAAEAALPGRFQHDATGALVGVDLRPFNAAREHRDEARLQVVFSHTFRGAQALRVPGAGTFGGGHAFGASGRMIQATVTDTVRLVDRLALAPGTPMLDLVGADPLGDLLRVPRHKVEAQFTGTFNGVGLRANATWTHGGPAGAGTPGALGFADRLTINGRLFWFPARTMRAGTAPAWLRGVRVLLALDNLLDSRQHVTLSDGTTPLAYQRGLLDPIGRTVRLSIRKTFD